MVSTQFDWFYFTEAEYAYKLQKKVVPLLVEEGYNPDGWLGALQGMKLYYKFFSEDLSQTDMTALLGVLDEMTTERQEHDEPEGMKRFKL